MFNGTSREKIFKFGKCLVVLSRHMLIIKQRNLDLLWLDKIISKIIVREDTIIKILYQESIETIFWKWNICWIERFIKDKTFYALVGHKF